MSRSAVNVRSLLLNLQTALNQVFPLNPGAVGVLAPPPEFPELPEVVGVVGPLPVFPVFPVDASWALHASLQPSIQLDESLLEGTLELLQTDDSPALDE